MRPDASKSSPPGAGQESRRLLIEQLSERYSSAGIRKRQLHAFWGGAWLIWVQILSGTSRAVNLLLALTLLLALAPLLLVLFVVAKSRGGGIARQPRLGRWGCIYGELSFASGPLNRLPALINVVKGDMSLIGPRPVAPGDLSNAERSVWRRLNVRPGLICLWWIRQRANIAYGSEFEADSEYLDSQSFWGDIAIGFRAVPAAFYGGGISAAPDHIDFLGIPIDNLTMDEAIDRILQATRQPFPTQLCFVNADCVNIASRDSDYKRILQTAGTVLADGIGVKLAGRLLNTNIRQNVNGTDLFPLLCAQMEKKRTSLYLLGGKQGAAADVAGWVGRNFPGLPVAGHRHGFFSAEETTEVLRDIRESGAEILLVAFGAPKQDKWVHEHLHATGTKVAMGVGGLFDFYSGRIPRAPAWVRELGMEWFYRFLQEPRRMWRRYFVGNTVFLGRVLLFRLRGGSAA